MSRKKTIFGSFYIAVLLTLSPPGFAQESGPNEAPNFNTEGELVFPDSKNWPFLSASFRLRSEIQPDAENIPPEQSGEFIIIKTQPEAIAYFKENGHFPEGTIFTMDFFWANKIESEMKYFGHGYKGTRVSVKDSSRFPKSWGYFQFRKDQETASILPEESCLACHEARASESDFAFTEFYTIFNK